MDTKGPQGELQDEVRRLYAGSLAQLDASTVLRRLENKDSTFFYTDTLVAHRVVPEQELPISAGNEVTCEVGPFEMKLTLEVMDMLKLPEVRADVARRIVNASARGQLKALLDFVSQNALEICPAYNPASASEEKIDFDSIVAVDRFFNEIEASQPGRFLVLSSGTKTELLSDPRCAQHTKHTGGHSSGHVSSLCVAGMEFLTFGRASADMLPKHGGKVLRALFWNKAAIGAAVNLEPEVRIGFETGPRCETITTEFHWGFVVLNDKGIGKLSSGSE